MKGPIFLKHPFSIYKMLPSLPPETLSKRSCAITETEEKAKEKFKTSLIFHIYDFFQFRRTNHGIFLVNQIIRENTKLKNKIQGERNLS